MLHIRHFHDERVRDQDQRDLAETNGDDDHRSDAGIYGFTVDTDPCLDRPSVNYGFAVEHTSMQANDYQFIRDQMHASDWDYIVPPDDPDSISPVMHTTIDKQLELSMQAQQLLVQAAIDQMRLTNHIMIGALNVPDRVITCVDGSRRSYYDSVQRNAKGDVVSISVPAVIKFIRDRRGIIIESSR